MKISVQDVNMVNWENVLETISAECTDRVTEVIQEAKNTLSLLKPGERQTLTVKVGSITVARPK